ncbi:hypothetical protein L596_007804 [Steinernema carpocapsae]|uniref:Uncharacterized protein n=1 Tax=Steinernema carpocapsae TaxID=34508 RepID=A0A4U5PAN7_STECR|nr:hypothetical protein L596_007804 [Steinernema carpocapsae]
MNAVPLLASSVAKPLLISCKNTHIPPNFKIPPGIARSPPRAKVAAKTSLVNNPNCHYSASTETEISRSEAFNKGELRRKEQKAQSCAFKQIRAEKFGLHLLHIRYFSRRQKTQTRSNTSSNTYDKGDFLLAQKLRSDSIVQS